MFAARRSAGRFSLLLLDENEFYVRDFVATCTWPSDVTGNKHGTANVPGQIRLCTKSLFFEPDDVRIPIIRLPFQFLEQLEGVGKQQVAAVALRWYKMKANAADEPYIFEKGRSSSWNFTLIYAALADFMPLAQRMLIASRLPLTDQEALLDEVLAEVEGSLRFDPGHLRSPSTESIVLEIPAMRLAPLIQEPCRLALTNTRFYLQPLHNISGDAAVFSHPLAGIAAIARRRSSLKDIGLEVFFVDPPKEAGIQGPVWGAASAFLSFKSQQHRDRVIETITAQTSLGEALPGGRSTAAACGSVLEANGGWLQRVTAAWQHGLISNFDYLLYCNLAAGRSFNDLTQYPIFPWVVQDYSSTNLNLHDPGAFRDLSRPIGALNPTRLAQFQERYHEMASDGGNYHEGIDPPFLYGTHYSCPGYTMFWLVRAAPAHMLRLQNGRFDAPDRLFCSISEAWDSVLTNQADVKELIPEFYLPEQSTFLLNRKRLALGVRQDGRVVGDVELPPWAENSVDRFLTLHRAALEAPFVSANLHHWIDLIFGSKQRGKAAVEADNVFRHLTYEGAIDPESITDPVQRAATEVAINEFGQCPRQIFKLPHPSRLVCPDIEENALEGSAVATSPTISSPRHSLGSPSGSGALAGNSTSTTNARHSFSLGLVSAIIATLEDEQQPHAREVPALLRELDVLAKRKNETQREKEGRKQEEEEEEERKEDSSINAQGHMITTQQSVTSTTSDASSSAAAPASPFAAAKSGLANKWSAFKDALGSRRESLDKVGSSGKELNYPSSGQLLQRGDESSSIATAASTNNVLNNEEPLTVAPLGQPGQPPPVLWKTASSPNAHKHKKEVEEEEDKEGNKEEDKKEDKEEELGESWGPDFRDRLRLGRSFVAGSEGVNAIDLAVSEGKPCVYTASHDGSVRIFDAETGVQLRAAHIGAGQPLTSVALLGRTTPSPSFSLSKDKHPIVLCGSYDGNVYAYNPSAGSIQGQFTPHADAVSCIALSTSSSACSSGSNYLATSSWDRSVKLWSLEQGRQPWDSTFSQPVSEVGDLPGGVWALALAPTTHDSFATPSSSTSAGAGVLVGTEEGSVVYIDMRLPGVSKIAWQKEVSQDYIGGVSFLPSSSGVGCYALAACADGAFALLDTRRGGDIISTVNCSTPLRCCATDGTISVAGGESGAVDFWDVSQQLGRSPPGAILHSVPGLDGLYPPLKTTPASPVSSLAVKSLFRNQNGAGDGGQEEVCLATGHEGGVVRIYWALNAVE